MSDEKETANKAEFDEETEWQKYTCLRDAVFQAANYNNRLPANEDPRVERGNQLGIEYATMVVNQRKGISTPQPEGAQRTTQSFLGKMLENFGGRISEEPTAGNTALNIAEKNGNVIATYYAGPEVQFHAVFVPPEMGKFERKRLRRYKDSLTVYNVEWE